VEVSVREGNAVAVFEGMDVNVRVKITTGVSVKEGNTVDVLEGTNVEVNGIEVKVDVASNGICVLVKIGVAVEYGV